MHRIALVNQKGGVGKSTTAVSLSAGLARLGKRVLLIDLDPQAHATVALGLDPRKLEKTVYTLLAGGAEVRDVILPVSEGLSLLPSSVELAGGEAELASLSNPHFVLKRALAGLDESQYDFAIVDSPPQLGFLNVNSLAWVRDVFIPVTCEFYALHGLSLLVDTVDRVRTKLNPSVRISAVIPCQVHLRRAITRDILADLERHFPGRLVKTRIRVNVRLVEAPSHGKPIFDYAPDSNGAADYAALAEEVLQRMGTEAPPEPTPVEGPAAEPAPEPVVGDIAAAASDFSQSRLEPVSPETEPAPPSEEPPYIRMAPGVPLTTPVDLPPVPAAPPAAGGLGSSPFAQRLQLAGLKPIVVAKPGSAALPPEKPKGLFGRGLFGKLLGRKD